MTMTTTTVTMTTRGPPDDDDNDGNDDDADADGDDGQILGGYWEDIEWALGILEGDVGRILGGRLLASWPVAAYGWKTAPLLACGRNDRIAILGHGQAWLWTQSPQCVGTQPLERKWRRAMNANPVQLQVFIPSIERTHLCDWWALDTQELPRSCQGEAAQEPPIELPRVRHASPRVTDRRKTYSHV